VIGIYKKTGSGVKLDRAERGKVMALAQARQIDAVLVDDMAEPLTRSRAARRSSGMRAWMAALSATLSI
jgi:hypothetical protein